MENKLDDRTKITFVSNIADVSLSHLIELMMALGSYREGLVVVGGWVPYLLLKEYQSKDVSFQHIGSKDIDIVVNPAIVDEKKYATILELLKERGYKPKEGTTFSFVKTVTTDKGEDKIQIDFLGPEYGGTPKNKRHQRVQDDFLLRKARGSDVVLIHKDRVVK
ncbi:nucleotidyltransferase domain-containing protein [Patescibacteria group bacterium]|nr:nucleotidyltransferase domain-containing protein [Patescibacteria group bacterium]MBU4016931.1 nucleotidyltransferase domain-containing protein [Patescibacteria group bacterium]MBU4098914.1 nucleotidyltransferase domain-containing protein [Patescibacteria group bacterium]